MSYHFPLGHPDLNEWAQVVCQSDYLYFYYRSEDCEDNSIILNEDIDEWVREQRWVESIDYSIDIYPKDSLRVFQKAEHNSVCLYPLYRFEIVFNDPSKAMLFKLTWL